MKRIEVGMLVRVSVECMTYNDGNPCPSKHRGRIGRVTQFGGTKKSWRTGVVENFWHVGDLGHSFFESVLEPINPDNESSTWEEVEKLTNWNPTTERLACRLH